MRERPILFSAPMVRAILEGRKTQTRRVVKLPEGHSIIPRGDVPGFFTLRTKAVSHHKVEPRGVTCPQGAPGDRLWVREGVHCDEDKGWCYDADGTPMNWRPQDEDVGVAWLETRPAKRSWYPSIHMPHWASRLTLEIVSVRVERLQEISENDAEAEGCEPALPVSDKRWVCGYRRLWESINGKRAPWASNPWVWVIEFKRVEPRP